MERAMTKPTKAYRAALEALADALAEQDPFVVATIRRNIMEDLRITLKRRHADWYIAMCDAFAEEGRMPETTQ
jgi:hypothetical protein